MTKNQRIGIFLISIGTLLMIISIFIFGPLLFIGLIADIVGGVFLLSKD